MCGLKAIVTFLFYVHIKKTLVFKTRDNPLCFCIEVWFSLNQENWPAILLPSIKNDCKICKIKKFSVFLLSFYFYRLRVY